MFKRPVLVLMTRWHASGRCKKRLASGLGSARAASIQKRLTEHTLAVAQGLQKQGLVEVRIALSGLASKCAQRWGKQQGLSRVDEQGQGSLGLRMRRQVLRAQHGKKARTTILIGTDLPGLCQRDVVDAITALQAHEIVFGPSEDGGYWLIGLTRGLVNPVATWPFSGIPWGTDQVLSKTLFEAKLAGIRCGLLRKQNDLDQLDDLSPWQA